jgi:hypothetical protein
MAETELYIVKTGRVRHEHKLYMPGESIELGKDDADKLRELGIVEREELAGLGTEMIDAETEKRLYVRGTLEFGPRHPAHGAPVLLDRKTAAILEELGIVSLCPAEKVEPEEDMPVLERQAPPPKIAAEQTPVAKPEAAPPAAAPKAAAVGAPDAKDPKADAAPAADKPGK